MSERIAALMVATGRHRPSSFDQQKAPLLSSVGSSPQPMPYPRLTIISTLTTRGTVLLLSLELFDGFK